MTAVAIQRKAEILERLADGKRISDIIDELGLGITRKAVSNALHADPEYRQAIETGFTVRLDQAEKKIEESAEQVDVARARAYWSAVAWRAEREFPSRWGQKTETKLDATLKVEVVRFGVEAVQQSNSSVTNNEQKLIGSGTCDLT